MTFSRHCMVTAFIFVWPVSPQIRHVGNLKECLKSFSWVMFELKRTNSTWSWYGCPIEPGRLGGLPT